MQPPSGWFDPAAPQDTAGPSDRYGDAVGDDVFSLSDTFAAEWLSYPLDLEVRVPDGQYELYGREMSPTSLLAEAMPTAQVVTNDYPAPPSSADVERQWEDFLSVAEDYLPGAS